MRGPVVLFDAYLMAVNVFIFNFEVNASYDLKMSLKGGTGYKA